MKEIGKLIELLNERHNLEWVLGSSRDNGDYLFVKGDKENKFYEEQIISKKFGFIKWLVENDKIDKDKVKLLSVFQETWYYNLYQSLLMILSIQDEPIEFLVSILK